LYVRNDARGAGRRKGAIKGTYLLCEITNILFQREEWTTTVVSLPAKGGLYLEGDLSFKEKPQRIL
jgi:hypothetical protein